MIISKDQLVVFDTNVASFNFNRHDEASFYESKTEGMQAVISFQTVEELMVMPIKYDWSAKQLNELMRYLDQYIVIPPNLELLRISARLRAERSGRRLNIADAWVAATALYLGCPLASHDSDFFNIPNLRLITALSP